MPEGLSSAGHTDQNAGFLYSREFKEGGSGFYIPFPGIDHLF
jgi:hypothetical protein